MNKKAKPEGFSTSRRDFIKTTAGVSLAAMTFDSSRIFAAGSDKLRVGLIGCGGRGKKALQNCVSAAEHLQKAMEVVATADWFKDRAEKAGEKHELPKERCFGGPGTYKQVIESDADIVLLVTPPNFRPMHFEAAVKAGKHVFMEKPVCVDPPGGRKIIEVGELAKQKGLAVVAGTQRRHQSNYRKNQYAVQHGAIGTIVGGCVWWCGDQLWYKERKEGESDADYMVRNWVSFTEMSGDHIIEQHVHNIDVANWFIGHPPRRALGFGGRARRKTGNQFDFFSVQYDYRDDCHIHSMCRQVDGCYERTSEHLVGTEGSVWGSGDIRSAFDKRIDIPEFSEHEGPYVQEHVDLLTGILEGKPLNEARNVAESTLTAIMGRISAYTGQLVRWIDLTDPSANSPWYDLVLKPTAQDLETGNVQAPPDDVVPIPGKEKEEDD
ncbi:MAG: Gfo/Idh/MocA family protein [Planctomycetota bacterium]|jgi:predicted dehydrogenase